MSDREELEELCWAFDVKDWLEERGGKIRASSPTNVNVAPCPICGDPRRDKFYVNVSGDERNGQWNSYCCHDQGNLVGLVMKVEGVGFGKAVRFIRKKVEDDENALAELGIEEEAQQSSEIRPGLLWPEPMYRAEPYMPIVVKGEERRLQDRGVTAEIIERYDLRATADCTTLGGEVKTTLDHRLIVPIRDRAGAPVSWQARDLLGWRKRKYLFPVGDKSSSTLYGIERYAGQRAALVVEGVFHKWAWDRFVDRHGVDLICFASFGKKLSAAQEEILLSLGLRVVFFGYDLDAATQVCKVAGRMNGKTRVKIMPAHPSGRDHDELTDEELGELLLSSQDYSLDFELRLKAASVGAF